MPKPDGPQFRRIVHASWDDTPPHQRDHPEVDFWSQDSGDRAYTNHVLFAADESDIRQVARERDVDRKFLHTYEVPESLMSAVQYADDDMNPQIRNNSDVFARTSTPELWETVPASRKDAVDRKEVIRFTNHREKWGSTSYILPKDLINTGKVRYAGVVENPPYVEDFDVDEDNDRPSTAASSYWKNLKRSSVLPAPAPWEKGYKEWLAKHGPKPTVSDMGVTGA